KGGLTIHDQPIPWNADVVLVEALVRIPRPGDRRKADFQIRLPDLPPVAAEMLRRQETEDRYRLFFRLPTPRHSGTAEVLCRGQRMGQIILPVLSREEFLERLRLQMPTVFVRLENQSVACQTFVATRCRGLLASAVLTSPTSLVPLADLELKVEFRSE